MIISNESMDFKDPKELDDPKLFDDQLEVWTLIIQKSTVIPPSLMVLFFLETLLLFTFVRKSPHSVTPEELLLKN